MTQIDPHPLGLLPIPTLHTTILALPLPSGITYAKRSEASLSVVEAADTVIHAVKALTTNESQL